MNSGREGKRIYRSASRREQATATHDRIVAAARTLLLERGYAGTTMADVAAAAGVSIQTLYSSVGGGKAALAKRVYDVCLVGDTEPVPLAQRAEAKEVAEAADEHEQLRRYAHLARAIFERVGPIARILRAGAATGDPDLQNLHETTEQERRTGTAIVAAALARTGALRPDVDQDHAARVLFALTSFELADALTSTGGWTYDQLEEWLANTMQLSLLRPVAAGPGQQ